MKPFNNNVAILFYLSVFFLISGNAKAQEMESPKVNPLTGFSPLIGGEWYLDNSYQTFEWGLGKLSVKAKSYFIVDDQARLVSEGFWFWHPGEQVIKGYFTAVEMPYSYFLYNTRFEENKMVNELTTYSSNGGSQTYLEEWKFANANSFQWSLYTKSEGGNTKIMEGTYKKK